MGTIKWVQLADVHFGSPDSHSVKTMRACFLDCCRKLQGIDYLFITGDLRFGKNYPEKYPDGTVKFLQDVQQALGISPDDTFMVPGNHDVLSGDGLKGTINAIMAQYSGNNTISKKHLQELEIGRQEYLKVYKQICGKKEIKHHFYISKNDVNVIHINTAILCGGDRRDGSLVIGMHTLAQSLEGIDKHKPAIVIAHHPFDCLEDHEQGQLEMLLKRNNAILYLCGHKHFMRCKNIKVNRTDVDLWEYVCGSNMDNPPNTEPAVKGFFIGELDTDIKSGYVEGFKWSKTCEAWLPNGEFSFPQDCAIDGRYYFPKRPTCSENFVKAAYNKYVEYLGYECKIRLDGLPPVDNESGSKAFELEKLFVPMRFSKPCPLHQDNLKLKSSYKSHVEKMLWDDRFEQFRWSWDEIDKPIIPAKGRVRFVIFSGPGGGKTTLMKRLASFYGLGNCESIGDNLPDRPFLPIWIKCRQFRENTDLSISEIIREIPERAGFAAELNLKNAFYELVSEHIQNGTALLLVDGLDEIGNDSSRKTFIDNLNVFAAMNKNVNIIMSSRIVGYGLIVRRLSNDFYPYKIQPFNSVDIARLCTGWYKIVFGDVEETDEAAQKLVCTILENEKIYNLAQTPVLLMTLLLVHLWIGALPTKRVELYGSTIDVLLRTWNVEGFPPLNHMEALPQLSYLAYNMMFVGKMRQTIGRAELEQILLCSRKNLPHFFSPNSETVYQFIERVEERSAILTKRGLCAVDGHSGRLEAEYEFSHLTFQEYLAAYAIVTKAYPNATRTDDVVDKHLKGLFDVEGLRETILLTAVLANRWEAEDIAKALLDLLTSIREQRHHNREVRISYVVNLLMQIIADEAPLTPDLRKSIYRACFDDPLYKSSVDGIEVVYGSKYGQELQNSLPLSDKERSIKIYAPLLKLIELRKQKEFSVFDYFIENIDSNNILDALQVLEMAVWLGGDWQGTVSDPEQIYELKKRLASLCANEDKQIVMHAFDALDAFSDEYADEDILTEKLLQDLLSLFDVRLSNMRIAGRFPVRRDNIPHLQGIKLTTLQKEQLEVHMRNVNDSFEMFSFFWFGVIFGAWSVEHVVQRAKAFLDSDWFSEVVAERLRKNMWKYLSILQELDAVPAESNALVNTYLGELEQYEKQREKEEERINFD
ncbi:MAG: metallophosphoesterase [Candidatus Bathyarchaeota archaeon]|nr:metallophosphoesterase [Candidatus Termitimicrobium sp.]